MEFVGQPKHLADNKIFPPVILNISLIVSIPDQSMMSRQPHPLIKGERSSRVTYTSLLPAETAGHMTNAPADRSTGVEVINSVVNQVFSEPGITISCWLLLRSERQ